MSDGASVSVMDKVHDEVAEYMKTFNKPPRLYHLNRKWGMQVKRELGVALKVALEADSRFSLTVMEDLSTRVTVDAGWV